MTEASSFRRRSASSGILCPTGFKVQDHCNLIGPHRLQSNSTHHQPRNNAAFDVKPFSGASFMSEPLTTFGCIENPPAP